MKKRTRPVFESFSDFISNLYEMELANPGSIKKIMLNEDNIFRGGTIIGNSYRLDDLTKLEARINDNERTWFKNCIKSLQISASANPTAAEEIKKFASEFRSLSNMEWTDRENWLDFEHGEITLESPYLYGDEGNVEVVGAPNMNDMSTIEKKSQYMSYSQMIALVSAYNASIFIKNLEIQKKNIDKPGEVRRLIKNTENSKGNKQIFDKMPLANPKDQLVVTISDEATQIVVTPLGELNPTYINTTTTTGSTRRLTSPLLGQFKYLFPVIVSKSEKGNLLTSETRQKIVAPDKSKNSSEVTDFPLSIVPEGKSTFYVTNEADLTDEGKSVASSLTRMFSKISKVVVEGSADKRTAGSPWKDNNELASARRDKMVEYLKELSGNPNSPLTGADIKEGKVSVQPKDGKDEEMALWRAVKVTVTGSIYDEIKNNLPKNEEKEPKVITFTANKKGERYEFTNCLLATSYNNSELKSDTKQFKSE
jgi:hypothetical protein